MCGSDEYHDKMCKFYLQAGRRALHAPLVTSPRHQVLECSTPNGCKKLLPSLAVQSQPFAQVHVTVMLAQLVHTKALQARGRSRGEFYSYSIQQQCVSLCVHLGILGKLTLEI